jgi:predicted outer membrane repeat protein
MRVAVTWYVDDSIGGAVGTSWSTAFGTLTEALDVAGDGDLIVVAEGTYTPYVTGARTDTFAIPAGVTVEGGYLGSESPGSPQGSAQNTILSGDIQGTPSVADDVYHVVTAYDPFPFGAGVKLRRVTIRDGNADGSAASGDNVGGGVWASNIGVWLADCYVLDNRAGAGGDLQSGDGGGIWQLAGSLNLKRCTFAGNTAWERGGAVYADYTVLDCYNCTFEDNEATEAGSSARGGAVYMRWTGAISSEIVNGKFISNRSTKGGAIQLYGPDGSPYAAGVKLVNCTFSLNDASNGGAAVSAGPDADSRIHNSILWGNTGSATLSGPHAVQYSDVEGGWTGTGNVDIDPLFSPNFHFREADLVDIGSDGKILPDELDLDGDGDKTEPTPIDLGGDPRIQGSHVDLGCYEEQ